MFVGESGVRRIIERTCQAMKEAGVEDPYDVEAVRALGVIDLPTVQKKANLHSSLTLDLFGSELSTNAANFFTAGLKGRFREVRLEDDHGLTNSTYPVLEQVNGGFERVEHPALNALNARLRDDFLDDCNLGVKGWNKVIEKAGIDFQLRLPHVTFHRHVGLYMDMPVSPEGKILSQEEWDRQRHQWLPGEDERQHIESLMVPQWERNQYAGWIAPPKTKINRQPGHFEWVKLAE